MTDRPDRYLVMCWVTSDGTVVPSATTGHMTLRQIFLILPDKCRWAVVCARNDPPPYHAIDMWDLKTTGRWPATVSDLELGRVLKFDDLDVATIAAISHK